MNINSFVAGVSLLSIVVFSNTSANTQKDTQIPTTSPSHYRNGSVVLESNIKIQTDLALKDYLRGLKESDLNPSYSLNNSTNQIRSTDYYKEFGIRAGLVFKFDKYGRVVEFSADDEDNPFIVSYNEDDSIALLSRINASKEWSEIKFTYKNGRLKTKKYKRDARDALYPRSRTVTYKYNSDGALLSASSKSGWLDWLPNSTYEFTTDSSGRITKVDHIFVLYVKGVRSTELKYGENGEILEKSDSYGGNALVADTQTAYTYTRNPKPLPNIISFLSAINDGFTPHYELYGF